ncbi:MAG TPA: OmpA family protein [Terriglobales bacterium]|jgi:outer membrane protein OmpA-like peptidoglycan-associated protein|nr:OmpA family protein [Terriglobales bacterium]
MSILFKKVSILILISTLGLATQAVNGQSAESAEQKANSAPIYKVTVVARTTDAINYLHHSGATKIDFRGTALLPDAHGEATVESKRGRLDIDTRFEKLQAATMYGPEYLTYVLWAITPEGRAENLGEVLLDESRGKLHVTTELQAFGLIVTAEPYFAVTQPSDVVVMENFVRSDTAGKIEQINARYELLERGQYTLNASPRDLRPMVLNSKTPIELYEARNALQIARWAGAETNANNSYSKAQQLLQQAEDYQNRKAGYKPVAMVAREAVQTAEDARIISMKKMQADRLATARERADQEAQARVAAEQNRIEAENQRSQAEIARIAAQTEAQKSQAEANQSKLAAEEAARKQQQAESEKAALRARLLQQLNSVLQTRDSDKGLVVTMADILFESGSWNLRAGTREKLARVAGVILSYPGLNLKIEGHTDGVGGDAYNQQLSEKRAAVVRDYLVQQGVSLNSVAAVGYGKTQPMASNDTAEGRRQNRRVDLIVSGEVIGTNLSSAQSE